VDGERIEGIEMEGEEKMEGVRRNGGGKEDEG
jgi:hypothetical protein